MNTAPSSPQEHASACILCSRNCGIRVTTENGQISKIKGDPEHPMTQGYICQKAARLAHYQNHAERLHSPLKRMPDGSFTSISWEQALSEIAQRLLDLKALHGGHSFAFVGGGGQGNHLGGAYGQQLRHAMDSPFVYSALAQEKTQDFWLNGRLFGDQRCHITEDVEHAEYVLFIGCNPYQSHGIPNARDTLKALKKAPNRTMVVIDPRRTETAEMADIHLQLKPGTDAFLLTAMLAIIVQEALYDEEFLQRHCSGFSELETLLQQVPAAEYAARSGLSLEVVQRVARGFAQANSACVRIDLGIQQTLHTTLNGYLEKLLYLLTGNFGKRGGNNLHSFLLPILGHSDERPREGKRPVVRTAYHQMFPIAGLYPPNILPDEILLAGEQRIRAVWVDSANPLMTYADTQAYEQAFASLELLVVVDVAMTETAQLAHYVLPAASQFEKCEATGFNLEFPRNFFHLRRPLLPSHGESLAEPEIYTRLLEHMQLLPRNFPVLSGLARFEPERSGHRAYLAALLVTLKRHKNWQRFAPSILYRTLGQRLPEGMAAGALLLPLALQYAEKHAAAVQRIGLRGKGQALGVALFRAIIDSPSGTLMSEHTFDEMWQLLRHRDAKIHLAIDEMLSELQDLAHEVETAEEAPFILMAGERRAYNANQIYRDPHWRKIDHHGAMRMHPEDAARLNVADGERVLCRSRRGEIPVVLQLDDSVRIGMLTLPHGYGMRYQGQERIGPALNLLTDSRHCDPLSKTPYHKYVPVWIDKLATHDDAKTA